LDFQSRIKEGMRRFQARERKIQNTGYFSGAECLPNTRAEYCKILGVYQGGVRYSFTDADF
jgi:hypothetical protein